VDSFDVTLCLLLLNNTTLKPSDARMVNALFCLQRSRNAVCHPGSVDISEHEFQKEWAKISSSLRDLGSTQTDIDAAYDLTIISTERRDEILTMAQQEEDRREAFQSMVDDVKNTMVQNLREYTNLLEDHMSALALRREPVLEREDSTCSLEKPQTKLVLEVESVQTECQKVYLWGTYTVGLPNSSDRSINTVNPLLKYDRQVQKQQITFTSSSTSIFTATPHEGEEGEFIGTWMKLNEGEFKVLAVGDIFTIGGNIGNANELYRKCWKVVELPSNLSDKPVFEREPIYPHEALQSKRVRVSSSRDKKYPPVQALRKFKVETPIQKNVIRLFASKELSEDIYYRMTDGVAVPVKAGSVFRFGAESSIKVLQADGAVNDVSQPSTCPSNVLSSDIPEAYE